MKFGFVTHWYDPEVSSASLSGTISRALQRQGDDIRVVTGFPIYPAGRVYPGYRLRPYQREQVRGVDVRRGCIYPSHDRSAIRRMSNYASFAASGSAVAIATLRDRDANLVFCSPATAAAPAMAARAAHGTPYVLHVQDLWPDSVLASGFLPRRVGRSARRFLDGALSRVYEGAHHVAVTSPSMAQTLASRGVAEHKLSVVPNWADEGAFYHAPRDEALGAKLGLTADQIVMYAGNIGQVQGLDTLVQVAARFRHQPGVQFALVGGGVARARLEELSASLGLTNIVFVEPQPFDRMAAVLALGTVQVVSLVGDPLFAMTLPSKLQATLCAGHPVLGILEGDGAELIRRAGAGLTAHPGDVEGATAALRRLLDNRAGLASIGARGRGYYLEHLSEARGADALLNLLREAAGAKR